MKVYVLCIYIVEDNKKTSHYIMYVAGDTYACATEESNACPLVPYFIFSFCLLISCQNKFTSADKWIILNSNKEYHY